MSQKTHPDTRDRILETARDLFGSRGSQHTSIREIAERLGLTKTAVLYHFSTKAEILAELAAPLLDDMEKAVTAAERSVARQRQWRMVEGLLDVYLGHREVLSLIIQNLAVFAQDPVFRRYFAIMERGTAVVVGPDPDVAERVRGTQALAMLSDPVILLGEVSTADLRREILSGVRRLYGEVGSAASDSTASQKASAPSRVGGRPSVMDPAMIARARAMHADGSRTTAEIAADLGVSRATLYRYLSSAG